MYSQIGLDHFGLKRQDKLIEVALKNAINKAKCGIVMERVQIEVEGCFSGVGDGDEDEKLYDHVGHKCISKLKGNVEFSSDSVLQTITTQKLGTFKGGENMGNYTGEYEQDYHGAGLLLHVHMRSTHFLKQEDITGPQAEEKFEQIFEADLGLPPYFEISDSIDSYMKTHTQILSQPLEKFNERLIACDRYKGKRAGFIAMNIPTYSW